MPRPPDRFVCAALALAALLAPLHGCFDDGFKPPRPAFGAKAIAERLCALGPRESGTDGAAAAAAWLADELRALGLQRVAVDTFDDPDENGTSRIFRNVMAMIPGKGPRHFVLLSHYDTKAGIAPDFVGANDGGSSTALLLALARWFIDNPFEGTLTFAFLDGEESRTAYGPYDGLHGSRRLATRLKSATDRIDGAILLDMVGDADLKLTIPQNVDRRLLAALNQAARTLGLSERVTRKDAEMIDDHQPLLQLGIPAIDIIDFEYGSAPGLNDYWHTPQDTVDKLSDETLDAVGALVIEMLRRL